MRYYSKRELYALGETLGDSVTEHKVSGGRIYGGGGKGGGGGTQQSTGTTYTTNVPEYARPYVETMLGATQKQLFNMEGNEITGFKPYQPYSTNMQDYIAPFSPLQQQAMQATGQLQTPGQFGAASNLAGTAGMQALGAGNQGTALGSEALGYGATGQMYGGMGAQQALQRAQQTARQAGMYGGMGAGYGAQAAGLAPTAQAYGQEAADIGMGGLGYGILGAGYGGRGAMAAEQGFGAGEQFARQATDPYATAAYMSPYMQNVVDYQKSQALRDFQIGQGMRGAQAVGKGAFGGSRQAIVEAEAERALGSQLQGIAAQGSQQAFQDAQRQQQFGANLGLQGLQAGYGGLGLGMQGAQTGLQGLGTALQGQQGRMQGLGQAGQFLGQGMQGAGIGLQGVGAQQAAGQLGLAGTAQGMQGAGVGLQGVQGAVGAGQYGLQGLGQATQAASTLGQLGSAELGAQKDVIGMQSQMGQQQQAAEQQKINQAIQDWANTQQYPLMQLGVMSNMLRGLPMQSATSNQYVAAPNAITQGIGLAGAGASIFNALKKEGGVIKEMASGGITSVPRYDVGGEIESKLYDMQPDDLTRYIKESSSPSVKRMAQRILKEKSMAGGGIIAFQNRGEVEDKDARRGQQLFENYEKELAENAARKFEFGDPKLLSDATPRPVPAPPVERANPAAVAAAYRDAEALRPPVASPAVKPPSGIQALNEAIINRASSLPKDFPAELSYEADKARSDLRQKAIEQGARVKPRETPAASEAPSKTEAPKEAGIKAASKAEPKAEPKAAPAAAGTGIKATPSDKIMPTAGIKLPDTGVPGLQMPVAPVDADAGKTTAQIAAEKEAYMGANVGAREAMAKLMAEKANSADEARRISALRMAEFFGAWGSTPGNTIVAGLNTLKNKIPDFIGDMKEETKIRRQIDKDIAEIEKIERLEKSGNYDEAAKRKAELGKNALTKYGYDIKAYSDAQQTSAYLKAAQIRGAGGSGAGGEDRALNNLIGKRTDIQKAITAKQKDLGSIVRIANRPDSKDADAQAKILDARAKVNAATSALQAELTQINGLINTYQKVQGLETPTPGTGAPGKVVDFSKLPK